MVINGKQPIQAIWHIVLTAEHPHHKFISTMTSKLFFDTEFTGLHKNTTLISIGIISECNKTFYAELNDYDQSQINDWLQENVINNLFFRPPNEGEDEHYLAFRDKANEIPNDIYKGYSVEMRCDRHKLKQELTNWLKQFDNIHMWSDCLSYDWVLFNDIFGSAFDIPKHVYYIPFDICTLFEIKGIDPDVSREVFSELQAVVKHNSMVDARIIRECHRKLTLI